MEIRRNTTLSAGLGLAAAALAIGWLDRASGTGSLLDWAVCVVTVAIAAVQLIAVVDGRLPLLVADDHGVRVRLHHEWLGLPWRSLEQVIVEQRDGFLRDGRLVVVPRDADDALAALLPSSRRALAWQRRLHGAPLAVPLSIATRSSTSGQALVDDLRVLADHRVDVVAVGGRERARLDLGSVAHRSGAELGRLVGRLAGSHDLDRDPETADQAPAPPFDIAARAAGAPGGAESADLPRVVDPVAAARAARGVMRVDLVRDTRPRVATPLPQPLFDEAEESDEPSSSTGAVVFDDVAPSGVPDPVIGPEIRAARERTGLDVDELSSRTRIRPHVLEALEVDDFGPCGGDFYARGHLRTLGRYLGLDADALVAEYDALYAHAPINARRVFEAELSGGVSGGIRATSGGPRWSLLVGAVLVLAMVWGVAQLFSDPAPKVAAPATDSSGSAGLAANREPITSPLTTTSTLTVLSLGGPSRVSVRDRNGAVLWSGTLHRGRRHDVAGVKPFRVHTDNGAATRLRLGKHWLGPMGTASGPARRTVG